MKTKKQILDIDVDKVILTFLDDIGFERPTIIDDKEKWKLVRQHYPEIADEIEVLWKLGKE